MCEDRQSHPFYHILRPDVENADIDDIWWRSCQLPEPKKINKRTQKEICFRVWRNAKLSGIDREEAKKVTSCDLDPPTFWQQYYPWFFGIIFFLFWLILVVYILIMVSMIS